MSSSAPPAHCFPSQPPAGARKIFFSNLGLPRHPHLFQSLAQLLSCQFPARWEPVSRGPSALQPSVFLPGIREPQKHTMHSPPSEVPHRPCWGSRTGCRGQTVGKELSLDAASLDSIPASHMASCSLILECRTGVSPEQDQAWSQNKTK